MPLQLPSKDPQPLAPGLYVTDAFHRHPLFAVNGQVVCSWNEAHALHGPARLADVNPAYVAALIGNNHNAQAAPYTGIRRLPRAHHVHVGRDSSIHTSAYDPLADGATGMKAEALHQFLRQGLIDHVQQVMASHAGAIGCEHSSGLDSNAVLGALVHGVGVMPERIHTSSYEEGGEGTLLPHFRSFYRLRHTQCHRLELNDSGGKSGRDYRQHQLAVFGAPAQIGGNTKTAELWVQQGCSLVFSGFGGDQAISHNASNVPTDLVAQRRWAELASWVGGKRQSLKQILIRSVMLRYRQLAERVVLSRTRTFWSSDLIIRTLTPEGQGWLGPHLNQPYPWEFDNYAPQHQSIRQRVLADWVAIRAEDETRLAAFYGIAKAFPLLDEKLISTLLQQDPVLFGEGAGRGRWLHRRAFAPFLPPFLRDNPAKEREPEVGLEQWWSERLNKQKQALELSALSIRNWHPDLFIYWDVEAIRRETEDVLSSQEPTMKAVFGTSRAIASLTTISGWWQALDS